MVATTKCHWPSLTGIDDWTAWTVPGSVSQLSRPSAPTHKNRSALAPPSPKAAMTPEPAVLNHPAIEKSSGSLKGSDDVILPEAPSNTVAVELGSQASGPRTDGPWVIPVALTAAPALFGERSAATVPVSSSGQ